jgi:hypothetical protein
MTTIDDWKFRAEHLRGAAMRLEHKAEEELALALRYREQARDIDDRIARNITTTESK